MFATLLMALAVPQPGQAGPGPADSQAMRMVPLTSRKDEAGERCTPDLRWCVSVVANGTEEAPRLAVRAGTSPDPVVPAAEEADLAGHAVWPTLALLPDGSLLAGMETRVGTAYSGGGGSATGLRLFRVSNDGAVQGPPLLDLPIGGSLLIRACFGEADMRRRRGACHDEYRFSASLTLAGGSGASLPDLLYRTEASAFPKGANRFGDSADRRLAKADLAFARDPVCSFTVRLVFDAAAGRYQPASPLPDCSSYTDP